VELRESSCAWWSATPAQGASATGKGYTAWASSPYGESHVLSRVVGRGAVPSRRDENDGYPKLDKDDDETASMSFGVKLVGSPWVDA